MAPIGQYYCWHGNPVHVSENDMNRWIHFGHGAGCAECSFEDQVIRSISLDDFLLMEHLNWGIEVSDEEAYRALIIRRHDNRGYTRYVPRLPILRGIEEERLMRFIEGHDDPELLQRCLNAHANTFAQVPKRIG